MNTTPKADDVRASWPALPFDAWNETQATLHRWMQIAGKVKLELSPFLNEWWNVAFAVTPTGMTSGMIPNGVACFSIDFDFVDHTVVIQTSERRRTVLPLTSRSVAAFHAEFMAALKELGIVVSINSMPVEIVDPVAFDRDETNASYDPDAVHRWWRILLGTARVMQRYRAPFSGKSSPIMFFWGSFDLTTVRFSGRPASLPESAPLFMRLAEDQENVAVGFWPGNSTYSGLTLGEPAFYAYIFPEPDGFREADVVPEEASYRTEFGQFILPYEAVRGSAEPEAMVLSFFESVYDSAARLASWDRAALALDRLPYVR